VFTSSIPNPDAFGIASSSDAAALLRHPVHVMWFKASLLGLTFSGLSYEVIPGGGSLSFNRVVNAGDVDEIRWFEGKKDTPLADPQAQCTTTAFEGLRIALTCRAEASPAVRMLF
jgi:hypothetical protein